MYFAKVIFTILLSVPIILLVWYFLIKLVKEIGKKKTKIGTKDDVKAGGYHNRRRPVTTKRDYNSFYGSGDYKK